jgi:hypothetical protein
LSGFESFVPIARYLKAVRRPKVPFGETLKRVSSENVAIMSEQLSASAQANWRFPEILKIFALNGTAGEG